ncbi:MAG: oxidoreductase [Acidimicrobiales bacterium]
MLNGWGAGETWGAYAERARLSGDWLVPLPDGFTTRQAMIIGTAGYTAMLCVMALEDHGVTPDQGEVLITGAAGSVGNVAIAILSKLGYEVVASTGRLDEADYLTSLGAASTIDRNELSEPGRPLGRERWAGVVDAVGSHTLVNACATTKYPGHCGGLRSRTACRPPGTVLPFILRGVTLAGVDSVNCPKPRRLEAWQRLVTDLDTDRLELMAVEIGLGDVIGMAADQLAGKVRGRVLVDAR